ncbi:MAG TPA: hypothetical protein VFG11_06560 [Acidobacteriota bacterium]|nr:hypothetical protein [Acidobacteriota bacterium]
MNWVKIHSALSWICFALFACWMGCAGNGQGLDQNGNPIGGGGGGGLPVAFEPTFTNIQNNVFTPICTQCHIGASAPQGLRLDEANSYASLVGVPTVESPSFLRVKPGDPDNSYIIRKLEGGPDIVGGQMPLNRTPLDQPTINAIRIWIAQGAPMD